MTKINEKKVENAFRMRLIRKFEQLNCTDNERIQKLHEEMFGQGLFKDIYSQEFKKEET